MSELNVTANRTLVKSPPELWTELSEVERLAGHLGEFGEIRITRTEPEKEVAWEGELGRGTVEIEASGWGTKVTLSAEVLEAGPGPAPPPGRPAERSAERPAAPPAEPPAERPAAPPAASPPPPTASWRPQPPPAPPEPRAQPMPRSLPTEVERRGLFQRLMGRRRPAPEPPPQRRWQPPQPAAEPRQPAWQPAPLSQPWQHAHAARQPPQPQPPPIREPARAPAPLEPPVQNEAPGDTSGREPHDAGHRPLDAERALAVLEGALDKLGSAHHRPFSRG